jgi:hypothetical protein
LQARQHRKKDMRIYIMRHALAGSQDGDDSNWSS